MSFNLPYLTLSYVSEVADKRRFADIVSGFYEIKASGLYRKAARNNGEHLRTRKDVFGGMVFRSL